LFTPAIIFFEDNLSLMQKIESASLSGWPSGYVIVVTSPNLTGKGYQGIGNVSIDAFVYEIISKL